MSRFRRRNRCEAAVRMKPVAASSPRDRVSEESTNPEKETDQILNRQEKPVDPVTQHARRNRVGGCRTRHKRKKYYRPPCRRDQADQQSQRDGHSEELSNVTGWTGAPRAAHPTQSMRNVLAQSGATDVVLDYVRRKNDAVTRAGGELAHHKILGKVVLKASEASNGFQYLAPRHNRRTDCEGHPFKHSSHQCTAPEVGV